MSDAGRLLDSLTYRAASGLFHQPLLLRAIAWLLRRSVFLSTALSAVATAEGVRRALGREAAFTHARYEPLLIDGPFLIGLPSGPVHDAKRKCLLGLLPTPAQVAAGTLQCLPAICADVRARVVADGRFDLITDYIVPLTWNAISIAYGAPAARKLAVAPGLLEAARALGAQLLIGEIAPAAMRQRALRSKELLDQAFAGAMNEAATDMSPPWAAATPNFDERRRDAIGMLWVGHPATTQAGALNLQELLDRPALYDELRAQAALPGNMPDSPAWRATLHAHVLELLRFRSPFPMLARTVPREATYPAGDDKVAKARPGTLGVLTIGALFDPKAQDRSPRKYDPQRRFHVTNDRWLIFGAGPRHCIAQDQVVEILVTALAGLLSLSPRPLRYAGWPGRRRVYDGPVIVGMPMRF